MNGRPTDELERLLNALADEVLTESDEARLADILRGDAAARVHYRRWMALHSALMWDYAAVAAEPRSPSVQMNEKPSHSAWRRTLLAAAAIVAVLVGVGALFLNRSVGSAPDVVQVEEVTGSLSWTGVNGEVRSGVEKGMRLAAGNFQSANEAGTAVLRFDDGTRLTLGGGVDLLLADDGQKRVHLKSGTLGAEVRPQPKGRPLLIRTPTATLEVVGTVFSVTAVPEQTTMNVQEGRVRLERLADGAEVEVPANHVATASLETSVPLVARRSAMPPKIWRTNFDQLPTAGSRGEWVPSSGNDAAHVKAVPLVVGRRGGAPIVHYGVSVRDSSLPNAGAFVNVTAESVLRLRYRTAKASSLMLFCITQRPGGAFGGNFELSLPANTSDPDSVGWRTADVRLSEMRPLQPQRALHPAGNGISHISIKTLHRDAGLEVAELSITPHAP